MIWIVLSIIAALIVGFLAGLVWFCYQFGKGMNW